MTGESIDKAKALLKFGTQALWGAQWSDAEKAFREAANIARAAKDERVHARGLERLLMALAYQGRMGEMARPIAEAGKEAAMSGSDEIAAAMIDACFIRFLPPEDASAVPMIQGIAKVAQAHPQEGDLARALGQAALVANARGERELARGLLERALPVMEASFGATHPEYALMLHNLADVTYSLDDKARFEKYEPAYRRAIAIQDKALAPQHPQRVAPLLTLGLMLARQGGHEEAAGLLERAQSIALAVEGPQGGSVQMARAALAELEEELLEAKAESFIVKRTQAAEQDAALGPMEVAIRLVQICRHYFARGKPRSAEPYYRKMRAFYEHLTPPEQMAVQAELGVPAKIYALLQKEKGEQAEKLLLGQLDTMRRVLPEGHAEIGQLLYFTGNFYRMSGKHKDALKTFERLADLERKTHPADPARADGLTRLLDAQLQLGNKKDSEKTAAEIKQLTGKKPVMDPALNEFTRQLRHVWQALQLKEEPDLIGAAMHDDAGACLVVGMCYAAGQGIPRNPDKARAWFELAAKGGDATAAKLLEIVRAGVQPDVDLNHIATAAKAWHEARAAR